MVPTRYHCRICGALFLEQDAHFRTGSHFQGSPDARALRLARIYRCNACGSEDIEQVAFPSHQDARVARIRDIEARARKVAALRQLLAELQAIRTDGTAGEGEV